MKSNNLANPRIWVVSIHDLGLDGHHLSFDTKEVLLCLGPDVHNYIWAITDLECTGQEAQPFCDAVEQSRRGGKPLALSWDELVAKCQTIEQTVEATILGIPREAYSTKVLDEVGDILRFPNSQAELMVRAIDSSFFEIITKRFDHVKSLKKCFKNVREEDATNYFAAPISKGTE